MLTTEKKTRKPRPKSYTYTESVPPNGKVGRPKGNFCTYEEAREWVRRQKFSNYKKWLKFATERHDRGPLKGRIKRPRSIPSNPQSTYAAEWISDTHFLGKIPYLPYQDAKRRVATLKLKTINEYLLWHRETNPTFVPRRPYLVYDDWENWGAFLGNGKVPKDQLKQFCRPFNEAVKFVHTLNLNTEKEYKEWYHTVKPRDLPSIPESFYSDQWQGWSYFLGKTITDKMEVSNVDTRILAILQLEGVPINVYKIYVEPRGKSEIIAKQREQRFRIIKLYKFETQYEQKIKDLILYCGSHWWEGKNQFMIRNIHELIFQLDSLLYWA